MCLCPSPEASNAGVNHDTRNILHRWDTSAGQFGAPAAGPSLNDGYTPDKSDMREGDRFAALEELFDAGTIQVLNERGVAGGWHCLEVGGGRGSMAAWRSERVDPTGLIPPWASLFYALTETGAALRFSIAKNSRSAWPV